MNFPSINQSANSNLSANSNPSADRALQRIFALVSIIALCLISSFSLAKTQTNQKTMCVYDPIGANGPIFAQMKDYQVAATEWGVSFKLKAYNDEIVAAEDFKSKKCDGLLVTGFKGREFNPFTGTLDSIGAMPSYDHLKLAMKTLATANASSLMKHDGYEVVGLLPAGAAFLYVNDRSIDRVEDFSGKRIGILSNDPAQKTMVLNVGASPVGSSVANLYPKFNNGSIDICAGPAVMYDAMELYKGLKPNGGIIRFPLAQLTMQMIVREDEFPQEFYQASREYAFDQFGKAQDVLERSEQKIPEKLWVEIPKKDKKEYVEMLRQARISLRDKGVYDGKMLSLMSRVRCKVDPAAAECTAADKE